MKKLPCLLLAVCMITSLAACGNQTQTDAAVCTQYGVPFVVIRAMSDKADGNTHKSIDNMGDLAADNSSRIVIQMMDAMRS